MTAILSAIGLPFIPDWAELRPFVADLWLIATIIAVLLAPFFAQRANLLCATVALAGLALAFVSQLVVGVGDDAPVGYFFRGMLVADQFAVLWKLLLLLFVMGVILLWLTSTASTMHEGDGPEFFTLLLGATLGMSLMASTTNLLMLFMAVELASLPSYVLAGFRKTHPVGAEASLKYVLFGAVTSSVMVYGLSMLYGLYGTLQLHELAPLMAQTAGGSALLVVAVFGLIVGIGFKISAVPFHFWCPDVFEGASVEVTTFLSVASKGAALVLLLRVLMLIAAALGWQSAPGVSLTALAVVIGVLGAVTCTVGNTAAFWQDNIKRLLAYSSIAHAGYMLCALSLLVRHGDQGGALVGSEVGGTVPLGVAQVVLLYLAVYLFMNLGAFTVAAQVWRETGSERLEAFNGLGQRSPVLAAAMTCCLVSLIGLPPFAGFAAKLGLLWVLFQNGGWWWALIVVIVVNTVISAFFYFRVVRAMYLERSEAPALSANPLAVGLAGACAVVLVLMLVGFQPLSTLTTRFGRLHLATASPADATPAAPAAAPATQTAMGE
jgi:NADH-quinone oxidoreductase subunit N